MIHNYFTIALRNLRKNPFHTLLNAVGLWAGILFALLIGAHIWSEWQVNRSLRHAGQQYFLTSIWKDPNIGMEITSAAPLVKRLQETYPHLVANYYRWDGITSGVSKGDRIFREGIQVGDSTLLTMFGFELLHGDPQSALTEPFSVVITEDRATRYFGRTDVVGESLNIQNFAGGKRDFRVTGVLRALPENSVTNLLGNEANTCFVPLNTADFFGRSSFLLWNNIIIPSYVELQSGASEADLATALNQIIQQEADDFIKANLEVKPVPLTSYYLQQGNGIVRRMLWTLALIGLFLLGMAIINFINLSIAKSGTRLREIGIRKALGGLRLQLIRQFLTESLLLTGIATTAAVLFFPMVKPLFEQITGRKIPALTDFPISFIGIPIAIALVTGLLAGLYPAFVLSSVRTVDSLKGKLKTADENTTLRKWLIGFQFGTAQFVMVAAVVVTVQVGHFLGKNLGYDKDCIVTAQVPRDWTREGARKMLTLRNEFARMPEVSSVCLSFEIPNGNYGGQPMVYSAGTDSATAIAFTALTTDEKYLDTYQISLLTGSNFDNTGLDSGKVILNERAVQALGFSDATMAPGRQVRVAGTPTLYTVKGVMKDFHFGSMQQGIQPTVVFSLDENPFFRYLSFKLKPENISGGMASLQRKWAELLPGSAFEYAFMDDTLAALYTTELQLQKAATLSALLALLIVLLGVLGLVSLSLERRKKEIGVRKVLGASIPSIIALFVKEFAGILSIAGLLVWPVSWYVLQIWLRRYADHIEPSPFVFVVCLMGLGLTILGLVGTQTMRAALANPVKSLRSE